MRFNLKATTDVAAFAVYDPASVPHLLDGTMDLMKAKDQEVASGRIFELVVGGDGEERASVFLDEELPEAYRDHIKASVKSCLLRVPSGRLVFSGLEDLWTGRVKGIRPGEFKPDMGDEIAIPPGNYLVDAYTLEWGSDLEMQFEQLKKPADKIMDNSVGPLAGCMIFGTVLVLPAVLVIVACEWGWKYSWQILKWAIVVHAVFWPLFWLYLKFSGAFSPERMEKEDALLASHPTFVMQMVRLADNAEVDGLKGGSVEAD